MSNPYKSIILVFILTIFMVLVLSSTAIAMESLIEARVFKNRKGNSMPYRIFKPVNYNPKSKYPLVLCLHGAGGRGQENKSKGTEAFIALSEVEVQKKYPAFLLTPQCPKKKQWVNTPWNKGSYSTSKIPISDELKLVIEILDSVINEFSIDSDRIYVTGQSMGGYGTWDMIIRYPNLFAAAVPVCGAGDPLNAEKIAHLPIWVFHGDKDTTVPIKGSRNMIKALKKSGSKVRYTEYQGIGHNSWSHSWKEKDLIPWLFKQHKRYAPQSD